MRLLNFKNGVCNRWMRVDGRVINHQFIIQEYISKNDNVDSAYVTNAIIKTSLSIVNTLTQESTLISYSNKQGPEGIKDLLEIATNYYLEHNNMQIPLGFVPKEGVYKTSWWVHEGILKRLIRFPQADGSFIVSLMHHNEVIKSWHCDSSNKALNVIKKNYQLNVPANQV